MCPCRSPLRAGFAALLLATSSLVVESDASLPPASGTSPVRGAPPAAVVTETIDGIACSYAPADETLARLLAPLVAALNREATSAGAEPSPSAAAPVAPLSVADFRRNRADYLARIATGIGLEKPTALQEKCYDGYLEDFERSEQAMAYLMEQARAAFVIHAITIVHRADLLPRLKGGEKIPGFMLDPDGEHGRAEWKPPEIRGSDERIAELLQQRDQRRLDLGYNYSVKDGVIDFSAQTKFTPPPAPPLAKPSPAPSASPIPPAPLPFPFVITAEQEALPPAELAAQLSKSLGDILEGVRHFQPMQFQSPAVLANLILHETTETGLIERYIGSRDRRWLCEGMANYLAWKITRDRAGEAAARPVYDLAAQLASYTALRGQVDLRRWPAAENQRKEDADTPLTRARYAFAARAVFLIAERRGEDFLPRLFREIGRTSRPKVDMRTVEKAYKKLAHEDLSVVLAAAVAPITSPGVRPDHN